MRVFLKERGLAPKDFWALSLPEIQAVLGDASIATRRSDLLRLMEAYPDARR